MGRRKRNSGDWKVLTQACTSLLERLPELADEHVKRLHEGEPAYGRTVPYDQHWQEAHGAMRIGIEMISAPRASPRRDLRHADEMGRRRAEQGIPLELVVQSYRHAGGGVGRPDRGRGDVPAVWGPSAEAGAIELVLEIAADEDAAHPRTKDEAAGCLLTAETRVAAGGQVTDSGAARPGRHRSRSLVSSVHPVRSFWAPMADACVGRSR
jgi:hypothetical protein